MTRIPTTSARAAAAGLLALALAAPATAQYYGGGGPGGVPSSSQAYSRGLSGSPATGQNITTFAPSSGGGNGYYGGGGNSQPVATPWSSQNGSWVQSAGSYWAKDDIARQQAYRSQFFQNQDYQQRQLQLKQATFDEMMYEKMRTPAPAVVREEQRQNQLARARNTPPQAEIASGQALNVLLTDLQRTQARYGLAGPQIPLDAEMLKHLNVTTTGNNSGSNELFKPGGIPDWPNAFAEPAYDSNKKAIQSAMYDLSKAQENGRVDVAKANSARRSVAGLKDILYGRRFQTSFRDYVDGLEFLQKLEDAVALLGKPGANNFLNGTYAAKGDTVEQLVSYMLDKGLKFAKATPGYEPYYESLYQRLSSYDLAISRVVGTDFGSTASLPPKTPYPMP
jgi:hypothetical protein